MESKAQLFTIPTARDVLSHFGIAAGNELEAAVVRSLFNRAVREFSIHESRKAACAELAKSSGLNLLQFRLDILQKYEASFFDEEDIPHDHDALVIAVLCEDELDPEKRFYSKDHFRGIEALDETLMPRAREIWQKAEEALQTGVKPAEREALFCAYSMTLDYLACINKDNFDTEDLAEIYTGQFSGPEKLADTTSEMGLALFKELNALRYRILVESMDILAARSATIYQFPASPRNP